MKSLLCCSTIAALLCMCEQVTKTKLGWALTAFTTSLSCCLHEGETVHGWFVATQIILMSYYLAWDMKMIFLSCLHLGCVCVYKHWVVTCIGCTSSRLQNMTGKKRSLVSSCKAKLLCHRQLLNYITVMVWILQRDTNKCILAKRSHLPQSR